MLRTRLRPAASVVGISGHFSSLSARQLQFGAAATRARAAVSSLGGSARPASAATAQRSFAAAAAAPGKPSRPSKRSAADAAPPAWQSKWEAVIGIEVHAQVISKTKLFSGASTVYQASPNAHASIVDAALPGTLPVLNKHCVQQAIRTGLALGGRINLRSWFERKHYFYCDLPQGYQITQQDGPIVTGGQVVLESVPGFAEGQTRTVRINRIQLEQDSGKSIHDLHPLFTYVDLNRAGTALMEIVSEPDIRSVNEAAAYVRKLGSLLRHIKTCDGRTDEGSLRADVNVSVRKVGATVFGQRVEIKNVGAIHNLIRALNFEILRQIGIYESGGTVERETRGFDAKNNVTVRLRSKEELLDYRFFPEPDLPPLVLSESFVEDIRRQMPALPDQISQRLQATGLSSTEARAVIAMPGAVEFFDQLVYGSTGGSGSERTPQRNAKKAANWLINDLFGRLHKMRGTPAGAADDHDADLGEGSVGGAGGAEVTLADLPVSPQQLAAIIDLCESDAISVKSGRVVLEAIFSGDKREPSAIVAEKNLKQVTDPELLGRLCDEVFAKNEGVVSSYKVDGGRNGPAFLTGELIKLTGAQGLGQAQPALAAAIVAKRLGPPPADGKYERKGGAGGSAGGKDGAGKGGKGKGGDAAKR